MPRPVRSYQSRPELTACRPCDATPKRDRRAARRRRRARARVGRVTRGCAATPRRAARPRWRARRAAACARPEKVRSSRWSVTSARPAASSGRSRCAIARRCRGGVRRGRVRGARSSRQASGTRPPGQVASPRPRRGHHGVAHGTIAPMARVVVRTPTIDDQDEFIARMRASRSLHRPWVVHAGDARAVHGVPRARPTTRATRRSSPAASRTARSSASSTSQRDRARRRSRAPSSATAASPGTRARAT